MKIGLVGYQGSGKSTIFELLTGTPLDIAKAHTGQVDMAIVPDERYERLVAHHKPKKEVPAKIQVFDTPGLGRDPGDANNQRLGIIREAQVLVHVIGTFSGADPIADAAAFEDDLVLADLQVINNRVERLQKDLTKPRPDKKELQKELEALTPVLECLNNGQSVRSLKLTDDQEKAARSYSLLTIKRQLLVLNTADSEVDAETIAKLESAGHSVVAAPFGLELELAALPEAERAEFAEEMGLGEPSRSRLLRSIFEVTDQITFYTSGEKEVHAWLLKRGCTVLEAADSIHSDLARGFVRAEVWPVDEFLKYGSERDLKAAGVNQVVGKEYIVQDGDEIFIRSGV